MTAEIVTVGYKDCFAEQRISINVLWKGEGALPKVHWKSLIKWFQLPEFGILVKFCKPSRHLLFFHHVSIPHLRDRIIFSISDLKKQLS